MRVSLFDLTARNWMVSIVSTSHDDDVDVDDHMMMIDTTDTTLMTLKMIMMICM